MDVLPPHKITTKALKQRLERGELIIFPTETCYFLGCSALSPSALNTLTALTETLPSELIIIPPSKQWITQHTHINPIYLKRLPGSYAYIVKTMLNNLFTFDSTLRVAIFTHEMITHLQQTSIPLAVTPLAYKKKVLTSLHKLPRSLKKHVSLALDLGTLAEKPPLLIDLTGPTAKIIPLNPQKL